MLPALSAHFNRLEKQRLRILQELENLPEKALKFKSSPGSWSILEVLEHLVLVEEGILKYSAKYQPGQVYKRTFKDWIRFFLVKWFFLTRRKFKAPIKSIEPLGIIELEIIRARWEKTREDLKKYLENITPSMLANTLFKHPIAGPMNIPESLDFIYDHIRHHRGQIRRIMDHPDYVRM